jgi:serine/threonine protein kinase/Tol biopolymer transport system component
MHLESGTKLGPYEILSPLGAGGMGEVWKAKDTRLDRLVAIKVLPEHLAKHPDSLARFEREAKAVAALNHPNITGIHDFTTQGDTTYVVMELLEGESLRDRLRQGPLTPRKAIELAVQMAHGLAAAHGKGIIHRDLKPDNLWINKDGRLKILDFGLAKQVVLSGHGSQSFLATQAVDPGQAMHTEEGMILGTMGYMSPEQVRGETVDARSDIFGFGAVLFEMLTGRKAFARDTAADTLAAILKEDPPEMEGTSRQLPTGLQRILHHCLEKNPEERFHSAHDMALAMENLSTASDSSAPFTAPFAPQNRRTSRKWAALGICLLVASILAGWLLRGGPAPEPTFRRLTFQRGTVETARFAPDGKTIVYSARWQGKPPALFSINAGGHESQALNIGNASFLGISPTNELAVQLTPVLKWGLFVGNLARVPMSGGGPREVLGDVQCADWNPANGELALTTASNAQWRIESPPGKVIYSGKAIELPRFSRQGGAIAFVERRPEGGWSLLSEPGDISVLDPTGKKRILATGRHCSGLGWSPKGDEVWFTECVDGNQTLLSAVTLSGKTRQIWSAAGNLVLQDIAPDGRVLIQTVQIQDGVLAVDATSPRERDVSIFDGSSAISLSEDGHSLLINEGGSAEGPAGSVFLKTMGGTPPTKLGKGRALALSPDGKQVLIELPSDLTHLTLTPIASGQPKILDLPDFTSHQLAWFHPDGKRLIVQGSRKGEGIRHFVVDLNGGSPPKPFTPEGALSWRGSYALSPDGRTLLTVRGPTDKGDLNEIFPVEGGEPAPIKGLEPREIPIRWSPDGRAIYFFNREGLPTRIFRLELATGKKDLVKEFMPAEPGGITGMRAVTMTGDARTITFNYRRRLSELFVVEGLK